MRVLTIAGSDSSGGAGVAQDFRTLEAFGVEPVCAVTSVTAQGRGGLVARHDVPPEVVASQIEAGLRLGVRAVKTGMLANGAIVDVVARALSGAAIEDIVVDPVMLASSGGRLLDEDAVQTLVDLLIPLASVITPNTDEAAALLGTRVTTLSEQRDVARNLMKLGARAVIVTGGHMAGDEIIDVGFDGSSEFLVRGTRVLAEDVHGTGCMYSAALIAGFAKDIGIAESAQRARDYVEKVLRERSANQPAR
ncbi:MAG: bifunctional hydroxymethylpyrimidine kinase/phosphomethylpyrimidine kinase [Actinomycetota bacterium]|nr:bifunctional hydroxymethylpyrimidine kinase/phosphomethylpyrimidine kinase [Actinomycetota bacterium]